MQKFNYYLLLIGVIFISCDQINKNKKWNGGLIQDFGQYNYMDSQFVVDVFEKDGILNYRAQNISGDSFESKEKANIYQSWVMYYDIKNNRFWVQSTDIGIYVWLYDSTIKKYKEIEITAGEKNLIKSIPMELFNTFPNSDKAFCIKNGYIH